MMVCWQTWYGNLFAHPYCISAIIHAHAHTHTRAYIRTRAHTRCHLSLCSFIRGYMFARMLAVFVGSNFVSVSVLFHLNLLHVISPPYTQCMITTSTWSTVSRIQVQ